MLESVRKHVVTLPVVAFHKVPAVVWLSVGTMGSFAWLLLSDRIHPFVVYALQVYLTF